VLAEAPQTLVGRPVPRVAPPVPVRSDIAGFRSTAADLGIVPMPWQECAARYIEATNADGRKLYREIAIVVSRQNGKTTLLKPLIRKRLKEGRRIIHTAQNRELPREVFGEVADSMAADDTLFPERNGRRTRPRFANGQEEIRLGNGGLYRIVAPTRGGARGHAGVDLVIIDELREMDTFEFIGAAKPTQTAAEDPQIIYLSNAGDETSVVLNSLRDRAAEDPRLAYLEWSAAPDRAADDRDGWIEANPAIGHIPTLLGYLEDEHVSNRLAGTLGIFETEHLCRWVPSVREPLVEVAAWNARETQSMPAGRRTFMGVAVAPEGTRVSAALAWQMPDGRIGLRSLYEASGPIPMSRVGVELRDLARAKGARMVGLDPMTDGELGKFFAKTKSITGAAYAAACSEFVNRVTGDGLRWTDCAAVTEDLTWTARKENDETGVYQAVRANDDRPVTAVLAAIRAVALATGPRPTSPRIY
jgi:hypothetical protein